MSTKTSQKEDSPETVAQQPKATAAKWAPGKGEEGDVHAVIEQPHHDSLTGEQLSKPRRQSFNPQAWADFMRFGPQMGFWVREVLHAPKGVNTSYANPDPSAQKAKKKGELLDELRALEQKIKALEGA